jgi:hypothetical protein
VGTQEDAVEVDREHAAPVGIRELLEGVVRVDPRVVDEDVDPAVGGEDVGDRGAHGLLVRDVDLVRGRSRAALREPAGGGRQRLPVEVEQGDAGALRGEALGRRVAQAAGRPGDERRLPGEPCLTHARGGPSLAIPLLVDSYWRSAF